MKTYRELIHPNNGFAGSAPGLAAKLNEATAEGWTFETLIPVSGSFVCALLSRQDTAPNPNPATPSLKRRK